MPDTCVAKQEAESSAEQVVSSRVAAMFGFYDTFSLSDLWEARDTVRKVAEDTRQELATLSAPPTAKVTKRAAAMRRRRAESAARRVARLAAQEKYLETRISEKEEFYGPVCANCGSSWDEPGCEDCHCGGCDRGKKFCDGC
jgi:hypothetical protein